jgi:hypothetical protein
MLSTMAAACRALRGEPTVPGSRDWPGQWHAPDQPDTPGQLPSASPRPDSPSKPERSDETRPADRLTADDQRPRWSRDDLRQRLERLPPGHPSSPRDDAPDRNEPDQPSFRDKADQASGDRREPKPDGAADAVERDFWSEEPRFLRTWADHVLRWPAERTAAAVDRSRDPAGSWRGDGNQYLTPEQHAQAKDEIIKVREREATLTKHMEEAKRENGYGGWLEGLENRRKGDDRLKEKIAEKIEHEPGKTFDGVVRQISDAIRYTFCFESVNYSDGFWDVKQRLEERGHSMIYSKNHWRDDPEYKGINTRWVTPDGQRFEVQFHTAESFYAKQQVTHRSYERLRSPLTQDDERRELRSFQREVCFWIAVPEGVSTITDYPWKGHR